MSDRLPPKETVTPYETGADFWRDTAVRYGIDEARIICKNYFSSQLRHEQPREEHQFCRELFDVMYEDNADRTDPAKLIYPYDFQKADERSEASFYHDSRKRNDECAHAIDQAITVSCYKVNYYNLDIAAMKVINEYGFNRINLVLAHNIRRHDYDGRYSRANKEWASEMDIPEKAFERVYMNAHPVLLEDFTKYVRKFHDELDAGRFALPGRAENGTMVQGYEITRAIAFDDRRGFAIGHNSNAANPFVCWQFTAENDKRDFYWGKYVNTEKEAANHYIARVLVHMDGDKVKEIKQYPGVAQTNAQQNGDAPKKTDKHRDMER
jgi:hypothetical protein